MNTNTSPAAFWNLRIARGTTGTVHAAREVQTEILDFNAPTVEARFTGRFRTETIKACGFDPNTFRRVGSVGSTEAEVTCKKCLKVLGA